MFAIVAPSFDQPSETFIRGHALDLAPSRTAFVCIRGEKPPGGDGPLLSGIRPWHGLGFAKRRLSSLLALKRHAPGLWPPDARRLVAFLRKHGVEAVLAEYGPTGVSVADTCAALDIPLYVHFHGYDVAILGRNPHWRQRYARLFPRIAGAIVPSAYLGERLAALGCPRALIHVNPCGVDPEAFRPSTPEPGRVLAVGRLTEKKAPHLTIRAFAVAAAERPNARLDIVGEGPLRPACEAEIAALGLGDRVRLLGAQPHDRVEALMQRASLFLQHSVEAPNGDIEGLPVAILEAMASALPVVATRHSGIPEAAIDGVTALLVEEHDTTAMGKAIARLLDDPDLARSMGVAGRERVLSHFTHAQSCATLRNVMGLANSVRQGTTCGDHSVDEPQKPEDIAD